VFNFKWHLLLLCLFLLGLDLSDVSLREVILSFDLKRWPSKGPFHWGCWLRDDTDYYSDSSWTLAVEDAGKIHGGLHPWHFGSPLHPFLFSLATCVSRVRCSNFIHVGLWQRCDTWPVPGSPIISGRRSCSIYTALEDVICARNGGCPGMRLGYNILYRPYFPFVFPRPYSKQPIVPAGLPFANNFSSFEPITSVLSAAIVSYDDLLTWSCADWLEVLDNKNK
jgi:hypothetical protein